MRSKFLLVIFFLIWLSSGFSQQDPTWAKCAWLIGDWKGEGDGKPGQGSGTFSLKPDLNNKILVRTAHSVYPAAGDKPAVIHDDLLIIYPDYTGNPAKAIYFDNEGHTINYGISYADRSITLLSDRIPNVPVFRLTYNLLDESTVNVKFEMSQDGTTFMTYVEGKCKKIIFHD